MQTLDVGELATITTEWYDANGNADEPSSIDLTITKPDGSTVTVAKAQMTQGDTVDVWRYTTTADAAGLWRYDVEGVVDGADVALPSGQFLVGVAAQTAGPCEPWCSWDDVLACPDGSGLEDATSAQRESAVDLATEILWDLSGRVYSGICTTTRSLCLSCLSCWPTFCTCEPRAGVDLGIRSPVWAVWDVIVDGETLDPSEYTLIDRRWLARTNARAWPRGWNMLDPDQFRATWAFGTPVTSGGKRAASLYAAHIARRCLALACSASTVPVTSVNAEGVSYVVDPAVLDTGRTGIELVDAWLVSDRIGRRPRPNIFAPGAMSPKAYR